jgi:CCR4-NOT transcriptional regulation complex NOT5 subunit
MFGVRSPKSVVESDLTPQDFGHALSASLSLIPDAPYEAHETLGTEAGSEIVGYPQNARCALVQPEFFAKYDIFTLFFIFFYSTGRPQQFFAGQELKKRDWKFHTRYQTWFRRVKEPTEKAPHYEIGEFEYFDHSSNEGWCIRQRPGFKFEYEHLAE